MEDEEKEVEEEGEEEEETQHNTRDTVWLSVSGVEMNIFLHPIHFSPPLGLTPDHRILGINSITKDYIQVINEIPSLSASGHPHFKTSIVFNLVLRILYKFHINSRHIIVLCLGRHITSPNLPFPSLVFHFSFLSPSLFLHNP